MTDGISDNCNTGQHDRCLRCPRCLCHGDQARKEATKRLPAMSGGGATWHPSMDEGWQP